jgi:NADH:ubiquinone oxidoreductase subunit 6 (subunit J)
MEQKITTPVVKGVVISLILIVFSLTLYFVGQSTNQGLSSVQYVIMIGGIIWGCINYSNQLNHNVTFGNVFAHGFKITAVITVITIIYTVIALKVLFPDMVSLILDKARQSMAEKNMSDEQTENALSMTRKFLVPFAIAGILVMFMIVGCISSLVGAAVAKKNPQSPFTQQG